jgi:hypothetical protein
MWHIWETEELLGGFGVKSGVKNCIDHRNTDGRITSVTFLILRTEQDVIKIYIGLH